eukprot:763070-Hanusia_phi.AAC.1
MARRKYAGIAGHKAGKCVRAWGQGQGPRLCKRPGRLIDRQGRTWRVEAWVQHAACGKQEGRPDMHTSSRGLQAENTSARVSSHPARREDNNFDNRSTQIAPMQVYFLHTRMETQIFLKDRDP